MTYTTANSWEDAVRLADLTAVEVCETYYRIMDTKRTQMSRLYANDAVLIWNGVKNSIQVCITLSNKFLN